MIKRVDDFNVLSNEALTKIAEIVNKTENKSVFDVVDSEEKAVLAKKQLKIQGYDVKIEPFGEKFKVIASIPDKIKLSEAVEDGAFKKLAWGRYCFQRESALGMFKYDFDDGSIWKVMVAENGEEYLVKEVDEENEEVKRIKKASANNELLVDDNNYKEILSILYNIKDSGEETFASDVANMEIKDKIYQLLHAKLNEKIELIVTSNHFIQTPSYMNDVKGIVKTAINYKKISTGKQLEDLIQEYSNQMVTSVGKMQTLF